MTTASPITQTRSRTDGSGQSILAILLLTSGILLGCFTIYVCFAIQWRGPFRDLWEFVGLVNQMLDGNWDIDALIEPYGGIHRIALPKLLFYLDYRFAAGSNWLAMIFILVVHSCAALLFLRSAAITQHARHDKFVLAALALWCFYSTTQIYNLIYVSDYQVPLSNALCVLAAWWFACVFHHHKFSWLFIINAVIIVASFSHASALMLWPAVIAVGFAQQLPQRWLLAQLLLMAIVIALYVSGHDPLHAGNETLPISSKLGAGIFSALHNLPSLLRYIGLHLGSPLSRDYPVTGIIISYLTVAYVSWLLVCVRNKKQHSSKSDIFWLTIACYGIFIAIITAWGRQIYPNSALTDRYQTLVMTYWAAVLILLYRDLQRLHDPLKWITPALALALLLPWQYSNAVQMAWLSSRVNIAHTAAITGITDIDTVAATLSHPLLMDKKNLVAVYNNTLRDKQLAYFSEPEARWFLHPPQHFDGKVSASPCPATLQSAERIQNNLDAFQYRLTITLQASDNDAIDGNILIIDAAQQVIGLARDHRRKGELLPLRWRRPEHTESVGFIQSHTALDFPLRFLANTGSGYCPALLVNSEQQLMAQRSPATPEGDPP